MFFKLIYYTFFVFIFALGALLVGTLAPIPGNYQVKIVQSGSMEPAIPVGAAIFIAPADSYDTGDVITFGEDTADQIPTTHRIVDERITGGVELYTTKGDANDDPDPREVRENEILGKVFLSIPYLGYVLDFARKPYGFAILVGIPALFIIIEELQNIWREVAKMREKKQPIENESTDNTTT